MMHEEKTNVMRIIEQRKARYAPHYYDASQALSGEEVAAALGEEKERVFKTLVTVAKSRRNYVFMIPVARELDLKKAAAAVGEKALDMLPQKELLPLTGYVHGGCSPIGMKKFFQTTLHCTAADFETIIFSGGKVGTQVEMPLTELQKVIPLQLKDIVM
ncbi:MAG: Cys-tRNA(Pro) deacylase [Alphaproteobacteria bacterium]|nr:Cys-tRNA(Pro) deacylase [Alphaproteobacteria bacterium]